ncbi:MAG: serine--tRNA ligase [Acidimicrobiia bacterium]
MIDVAVLRNDPEALRKVLARRLVEIDVDLLAQLDEARRRARARAESLRAEQKRSGKQIADLEGEPREAAIERAGELADQYRAAVAETEELDVRFGELWERVPNLPHDSVPDGATDEENVELKRWGDPPAFAFDVKDHQQLGAALDIIDLERAAKVSGSRFGYLKGAAVLLELGLVRWTFDRLVPEGFIPVVPPVLVREAALRGTGFFPDDQEQVYAVPRDDLFLAGTSEVPIAAMHADEILDAVALPLRYVGFSTCFRREAGTYGKDTGGIFRVHQFDKVEMFSFCQPERSWDEHDFLLERQEGLMQALGIPYRVVNVCTGDLGSSAAKKYDIEAWIPSRQAFREITSCSNTTDYQARRLKIRLRSDDGTRLVHTLNGTAVAVGRTLIAIVENYQQEDGSIVVPEVLRPYVGVDRLGP